MDEFLYAEFIAKLASGRKEEARLAIRRFIESFKNLEEREDWTRRFLSTIKPGTKLRHELYEEVVLPVLMAGYEARDPWSLYWLAQTSKNARYFDRRLDLPSSQELLKEAHALDPSSDAIRHDLLRSLLYGFEYMAHEWPTALLYAPDSPWQTQYREILAEIRLARELDTSGKYAGQIAKFEEIVAADAKRKKARP